MKQFLLSLTAFFILSVSAAQDTVVSKKILLVAFNPEYYLSDAEQDLMKQNRRTPEEYRHYLRRSLDNKIAAAVEKLQPCYSLLADTNRLSVETTYDFYNHSALQYRAVYGVKPLKENDNKGIKKSSDEPHDAFHYHQIKGDLQCMDNSVRDSSWLRKMTEFFESDLILSINQFEIKTNYNSCLDIANKVYRREVHVHYTLMDASGKSMQGNIAIGAFPSNSNRVEEIAEMVFPEIASYIASQLQGPVR